MGKKFFWPGDSISGLVMASDCHVCKLYKSCKFPKMPYGGRGKENILCVGEGPDRIEDSKGDQFVGETGEYLEGVFAKCGISLHEDCYKDNAIRCRAVNKAGRNRSPTDREIGLCSGNVENTIKKVKPKKIILLGESAIKSVVGGRGLSIGKVSKWTGFAIPDQKYKCWIFPTFHPSYVYRNLDDVVIADYFYNNIKNAVEWDKEFPDYEDEREKPDLYFEPAPVISFLHYFNMNPSKYILSIDFETSGIKPYVKGHYIRCMSISIGSHKAVAFPIFDNEEFRKELSLVLTNPKIKKIAHNLKFEDTWADIVLGCKIKGWLWDTMLAAHVLDNRTGITGLKMQTYLRYGTVGYDNRISKYLHSGSKDDNAFNRVGDAPLSELLLYCGMDTMFTYRLFEDQSLELVQNSHMLKGNDLLLQGTMQLATVERNGIYIDTEYYSRYKVRLCKKAKILINKIQCTKEVEEWRKYERKKFNPASSDHLKKLLFDILGYESDKETKKGNRSVDEEVLDTINTDFTKSIIALSKVSKINDTFIEGFLRECRNHILHPFFNLNSVRTFRSSSNSPNWQNVPKHDKLAQKIIRSGIKPRPGNRLIEADYSAMEVKTSACVNLDPRMLEYCRDLNSDMHRDQSLELFFINATQITKDIRFIAKNNFVFAEFYGSYYVLTAADLWENIQGKKTSDGYLVTDILADNGIYNYPLFENHVKGVEKRFWGEKFKVYDVWRKKAWENYRKCGYIDLVTGFRCFGIMRKNQILNIPIQGPAFHCLLWSLIRICKIAQREHWRSKVIGQIHDSIILDVCSDEYVYVIDSVRRVMTQDIKKYWDWIVVPLIIEIEASDIDGNWANMKEIDLTTKDYDYVKEKVNN